MLLKLQLDLASLKTKYAKAVDIEDRLIVRPKALTKTVVIAHKVKNKYQEMQKRAANYKALESNTKVGRPKKDCRYRNRVGRKAAKLCKVTELQ